jgi:carbon-monoxide dehydrogenase medium subunit
MQEAFSLLDTYQQRARVLAGGTDLYLRMERRVLSPEYVIDLKKISDLNYIRYDEKNGLKIGSMTLHRDIVESSIIQEKFPILASASLVVGSNQTRNRATLGGNLCNASPAADTASALLVLGATVKVASSKGERILPLEKFFKGPGSTVLAPNEILTEIDVKPLPPRSGSSFKRHTRSAMDIAVVNVAVTLALDDKKVCRDIKIGLCAVTPIPLRAYSAEAILKDQSLQDELIRKAGQMAADESKPISDVRSSAEYRRELVRVLTERAIREAFELGVRSQGPGVRS